MIAARARAVRVIATTIVVATVAAAGGCRLDFYRFYDVTRTPTEECDILPQGEFCDPEGLSPPVTESWSIERVGDSTRVYVDEEVWVASPPKEGDDGDTVRADKLEVDTREPGPCTNTITRDFEIVATDADIDGKIHEKTRLVGGEDCGDTPRGLRTTAKISGLIAGAP